MRDRGYTEIQRAESDGRWQRAYAGAAAMEVPDDLAAALHAHPNAEAAFDALGSTARYPILLEVTTASNDTLRAARITRHVTRLAAAEPPTTGPARGTTP